MKVAFKPVLWTKDKGKDGSSPIAISITGGGKRKYYQTQYRCPKDYFVDGKIVEPVENCDIINDNIDDLIAGVKKTILTNTLLGQSVTLDEVHEMFKPTRKQAGDFLSFYRGYIDNLILTKKKAHATIQIWETEYNQLKTFAKSDKLSFKAITADFLNRYHESLITYSPTTIFKKLKKLKQIIKNAVDRGLIDKRQIAGFEMVKYVQPEKKYLTVAQCEELANAIYKDKIKNESLKAVACYFLIACYSGLRVSDWGRFEIEKLVSGEALKVRAHKNKEPIYIPLKTFKRLGKILAYVKKNKIVFDYAEPVANRLLKDLQIVMGWDIKLHTHLGRHTAATLLGEMGYSAYAISQILGISENTAKIYRKYTRKGLELEYSTYGGL